MKYSSSHRLSAFPIVGIAVLSILTSLVSCASVPRGFDLIDESGSAGRYSFTYASAAVGSGLLGKENRLSLIVQLPPSYASEPKRRYPVIYLFHGYGGSPAGMLASVSSALISAKGNVEFILVGVDGASRLGGSFWADSPVTGDWERMVLEEAVAFVEYRFRCVVSPAGRAVAGFSMGGSAAWRLALAHPDVFGSFWAACPGALVKGEGIRMAMPQWDKGFRSAYGAAFAPAPELPAPHAAIPVLDGSPEDEAIISRWEDGFGKFNEKIDAYLSGKARLVAGRFESGTLDYYKWIVEGTRVLADELKAADVPVEISFWEAGHSMTPAMIREGFLPFFERVFAGVR